MRNLCIALALGALALVTTSSLGSAQAPDAISEEAPSEASEGPTGEASPAADADAPAAEAEVAEAEAPEEAPRLEAGGQREASAEPAKVAVVTVGDPDDGLRGRARELDRIIARTDGVNAPTDSGLRRALRGGSAPDEDDGLGRVRVLRRGLGVDDAEDAGGLAALGRVSGAVAVIAIRRLSGGIQATMLDVASGRLYEGELELNDADDDAIVRFVLPRAQASALRAQERAADDERRDWRGGAASARDGAPSGSGGGSSAAAAEGAAAGDDEGQEEDERGFFAKWWPYMVGALLLGGALVYAFAVDTTPDASPPVLRFIPGGN